MPALIQDPIQPDAPARVLRVLLVDDHELVRRGLRSLLDAEPDLEVAGDLNDPKVNTWSLVWQALKKVIVKVTTAPFRFLGNLVGIGGDELEFIEFEAGHANLTPPQHERLDSEE